MKYYHVRHKGFIYPVLVKATSKKQALADYRKQYNLVGKRVGLTITEAD